MGWLKGAFQFIGLGSWIGDFNSLELVYALCIALGAFVLLTRIVLQLFGGGDADVDLDIDADLDIGDADGSFRLFSLQGLSGFLLMFGLAGLAFSQAGFHSLLSLTAGSVAGTAMMVVLASLVRLMYKMQSSGSLKIDSSVGCEGSIYLTIPAGGTGRAQIRIGDRMRTLDAASADKQEIPTGERVKVIKIVGGNTVLVNRLDVDA